MLAALIVSAIGLTVSCRRHPEGPRREIAILSAAREVVGLLNQYRDACGRYPETLAEIGRDGMNEKASCQWRWTTGRVYVRDALLTATGPVSFLDYQWTYSANSNGTGYLLRAASPRPDWATCWVESNSSIHCERGEGGTKKAWQEPLVVPTDQGR